MKNDINELEQQLCTGKEHKEKRQLENIQNDKGFVSPVISKTWWKESQEMASHSFHSLSESLSLFSLDLISKVPEHQEVLAGLQKIHCSHLQTLAQLSNWKILPGVLGEGCGNGSSGLSQGEEGDGQVSEYFRDCPVVKLSQARNDFWASKGRCKFL